MPDLVMWMRAYGVRHLKLPDLELEIEPGGPALSLVPEEVEPTYEEVLEKTEQAVAQAPEIRKDGLTPEEQVELFGREMS